MKVLVTGSHGYLGSVVAPALAAAGHEVVGLDTCYYEGCDFGVADGSRPALALDVRDVGERELAGFDAVVHLAALSNDPVGDLNAAWTHEINLDGTVALARAARAAGVRRFVFASSCSMYGTATPGVLVDEEAPLRPLTAYAETKVRAEEALRALADGDFSPVFMRNATAFGSSPRLRLDVVLNNLAAWAHTTGTIRLLSDGTAWRPLVHVRDIAAATIALLEAPRDAVHAEAFNIGSDAQNYRVRELAEIVRARAPGCEVEIGDDSADPRSYAVDFGKLARAFPGCRLEWSAERGAEELLGDFRRHGLTLEDFQGDRYVRVARLKRLLERDALDAELRWRPGSARP